MVRHQNKRLCTVNGLWQAISSKHHETRSDIVEEFLLKLRLLASLGAVCEDKAVAGVALPETRGGVALSEIEQQWQETFPEEEVVLSYCSLSVVPRRRTTIQNLYFLFLSNSRE